VLQLLAEGLVMKEIADLLDVTLPTVVFGMLKKRS
jgi:DNA-binding CsgD family transcriptional regulator